MCYSGVGSQAWFKTDNSQVMNLQSYGPRSRGFLLLIWPVCLHQVFKHGNEKRFREIAQIKLPVSAQANVQSFLLNYHIYQHGTARKMSPISPQFVGGEAGTRVYM